MELLAWLGLALAVSLATSAQIVELHSPRYTEYGDWQGWAQCDEGTYAAGIKIKAEGDQRGGDDTGLNAVALFCLPINWNSIEVKEILSGEGGWGGWQALKWCPRGQVIVGFQLRSEPDQRGKDDVAADNFAAFCGSPFSAPDHNNWIMGDTAGWGEWTAKQFCPQSYAVCAINTQIEGDQGGADDTALNNVDLRCCKVDYSCQVLPEVETLQDIENSRGGNLQSEYTVHTSFTKTTGTSETMSSHEKSMIGNKISGELGYPGSSLNAKLAAEHSNFLERGSSKSLQIMVQKTTQSAITKKLTINIPAGKRSIVKQLIFTCGGYRMKTEKTINILI